MADRCSASITIGGKLAAADLPRLLTAISDEGLSTEFDGPKFELKELVSGEPLLLCAHEVSWGTFTELEAFCRTHKLAYTRWTGMCAGVWGCFRTVYRGAAETREGEDAVDEYDVSEDDQILIGEQLAHRLGSFRAIADHFVRAAFAVPPLVIVASGPEQREPIAPRA